MTAQSPMHRAPAEGHRSTPTGRWSPMARPAGDVDASIGPRRRLTTWVARIVNLDGFVEGNPTGLFGSLWASGGVFTVMAALAGAFDEGDARVPLVVASLAIVTGLMLLRHRDHALPDRLNMSLTLCGAVAVTIIAASGGPIGGTAVAILYVYVAAFAYIATPRYGWQVVAVSAGLHLAAVLLLDQPGGIGAWVLVWGTVSVTGGLFGIVVSRMSRTARQLAASVHMKSRFLATVTHELRTPLTAVLGSAETLLDPRAGSMSSEQRHRLLAMIQHHGSRQLRLVEDLLTMSLAADRTLDQAEPEDLDVMTAIAGAVDAVGPDIGVDVETGPGVTCVRCDPTHLERIVVNLLVNAVRYGEPPFVVRTTAIDETRVVIDVVDHGTGIDGGLDSALMEPFVQGDTGDRRESQGVGLGLAIVRELVAINDGTLRYEDTPGGGATIGVELPRPQDC